MTHPTPPTLASLHAERNAAFERAGSVVAEAKAYLRHLDVEVESFAKERPLLAAGSAVALGIAAGLLLSGRPVRRLAGAAGLVVFSQLVGVISEKLLAIATKEDSEG